jgi:hypothetical protein
VQRGLPAVSGRPPVQSFGGLNKNAIGQLGKCQTLGSIFRVRRPGGGDAPTRPMPMFGKCVAMLASSVDNTVADFFYR